jgi:archaeosine-15-forming tRNA-guanine transglycosylase
MKSLAAVVAALLVTVGAANAGEIVINPKASDRAVVLTIRGGEVVKASIIAEPVVAVLPVTVGAANAGEIVINPKAPDRAVVLTTRGGKIVKASVIAKPEPLAKLEHSADFARTP